MASPASRFARQQRQAIAQQMSQGLYKAYRRALEDIIAAGNELGQIAHTPEAQHRQALFQRVGALAQRSVLASYDQVVKRREGPSGYRAGMGRFSGGVLRRALASPEFFTATADGIQFGNIDWLDANAAQWHRLNFGAGGRGAGAHVKYPVNFGSAIAMIGFDEGPSPGFSMPAGMWIDGSGQIVAPGQNPHGSDAFWPGNSAVGTVLRSTKRARPAQMRATHGIQARDFLGAGVRRIAEELPRAYEQYTADLVEGLINRVAAKRRRTEIIQGPTHYAYRPGNRLTEAVEGEGGMSLHLP